MSSTQRGFRNIGKDFYPTPRFCVDRLLEKIVLPDGLWCEPCAGAGALITSVNDFRRVANQAPVVWSAIDIRSECRADLEPIAEHVRIGDVMGTTLELPVLGMPRVIFTNPPFNRAMDVIQRCLRDVDHVVMLLRLNFLASEARVDFMHANPADVYVLPNRPSFALSADKISNTDSCEYAWFHWDRTRTRTFGKIVVLDSTPLLERRFDERKRVELARPG